MTDKQEQLSAFVDGELASNAAINALSTDAEMAAKWQRYHVMRNVMRKEMPQGEYLDISARIADALDQEPTVLAPKKRFKLPLTGKLGAVVAPFAKQSGQFAVAASVAAAIIVGVQTFNQPSKTEPFSTAPPAAGPQGGLAPVSLEQTRVVNNNERAAVLETRRHINALIADHEQQAKLKANVQSNAEQTQAQGQNKPAQ